MFLHTLFLEYATETGGIKCKAVFYTYKQIGMRCLELFWPCLILAKNLGDVLAHGLSIIDFALPELKGDYMHCGESKKRL